MKFISVHIPKTAGSSLKKIWVDFYGPDRVFLHYFERQRVGDDPVLGYRYRPESLARRHFRKLLTKLVDHKILDKGKIELNFDTDIDVIHGHFNALEYTRRFPISKFTTVVRDPFSRVFSHYNFWKTHHDTVRGIPQWFTPRISFEEFALHPELTNYMSNYIPPGVSIEQFGLVGIQEEFTSYIRLLEEISGRKRLTTIPRIFEGRNTNPYLNSSIQREFNQKNMLDCALFECAKDIFYSREGREGKIRNIES